MSKCIIPWTKAEDEAIIRAIGSMPKSSNYAKTFKEISKRLNRTESAIAQRWYRDLTKNNTTKSTKQTKSNISDKNSSIKELLEYARKHYPVGTEFVCTYDMLAHKVTVAEYFNINSEIWVDCGKTNQKLFDGYKWARVVSKPNQPDTNTEEVKPKQKGVFLDVSKLESLSITSLRELAVTKLVDVDKKKLIDLIVE